MITSFIEHIDPFFRKLRPLPLQPTGALPKYARDKTIKAVVFDIYGTLIISGSTAIIQSSYEASMFTEALANSGFQIKVPEADLMEIYFLFKQKVIRGKEKARARGVPFPELNIVDIWQKTLEQAEKQDLIAFTHESNIKLFIIVFELRSNPVWPMPGVRETLAALSSRGYPLGLVSNAQFYTPVILNYFLHDQLKENEFVEGFNPDLSVFSYKLLKGKPDTAIYEALLEPLDKRGLVPENVLFVGNDMLRDVYPAAKVGFKTCFFAGDQRVYRLRKDHPQASQVKPDHVITELKQLIEILIW